MRDAGARLPVDARLSVYPSLLRWSFSLLRSLALPLCQSRLPATRRITMDGGGEVTTINL